MMESEKAPSYNEFASQHAESEINDSKLVALYTEALSKHVRVIAAERGISPDQLHNAPIVSDTNFVK